MNHRDRGTSVPVPTTTTAARACAWAGRAADAEWDAAPRETVSGDYVVQERVAVARARFPEVVDGALTFRELSVDMDMDPYIIDGEANGFLTRIAGTALLNVTAGGGSTVPTFVLQT